MVVVAGDQHALDPLGDELGEEVVDELLGLGRRRRRVEHVAGDQDGVYFFVLRDRGHLVEGLRVLVHPLTAAQRLPDVPVGRVEKPHREASLVEGSAPRGPVVRFSLDGAPLGERVVSGLPSGHDTVLVRSKMDRSRTSSHGGPRGRRRRGARGRRDEQHAGAAVRGEEAAQTTDTSAAAGRYGPPARPKARSRVRPRCIGVRGGHDAAAPGTGRSKAGIHPHEPGHRLGRHGIGGPERGTYRGQTRSSHSSSSCQQAADRKPGGPRGNDAQASTGGFVGGRRDTPPRRHAVRSQHEEEPKGTCCGDRRARGPWRRCSSRIRGWRRL